MAPQLTALPFRAPRPTSNLSASSDRPQEDQWQGADLGAVDEAAVDWPQARRGLRLRTIILLRWISIAGQYGVVLGAKYVLGLSIPLAPCLAVVTAGAIVNLSFGIVLPGARLAGEREAMSHLTFDLVELSALLMLTGGLFNPFRLLLLGPVVVGAATLRPRYAACLCLLSLVSIAAMAIWSARLPIGPVLMYSGPEVYRVTLTVATMASMVFIAAYAWQAQAESQRMELALAATQAVLAREQRVSALGGLAAAAAHELGTPLATIQVVTKEMSRGLMPGTALFEDVTLLISQAERCREILRELARQPDASDSHHERMSLSQLMDEVARPHEGPELFISTEVTCAPGAAIMEVRRRPEVLHGLSAFMENAVDFAESTVEMTAHYDADRLTITIHDDGPGFAPDVMAKLGEPYVTTRSHGENSRSGHLGMGLGFFIAKTLLERSGARVGFRNARRGGAVVEAQWSRSRIEAKQDA